MPKWFQEPDCQEQALLRSQKTFFQNFSPSSFGTYNNMSFSQGPQNSLQMPGVSLKNPSLTIPGSLGMSFTPSPTQLSPPIHDNMFAASQQHLQRPMVQNNYPFASMQQQHKQMQISGLHQQMMNPQVLNPSARSNAFAANLPEQRPGGQNVGQFQGGVKSSELMGKTKSVGSVNRKSATTLGSKTAGKLSKGIDGKSSTDNRRKWTPIEDKKLRSAVKKFGEKNWKSIAEEVPGRNHVQCLQRWKKVLRPGLVKGHWTAEEDDQLRKVVKAGFKNWGEVAQKIEGRTPKQCRERWSCNLDPSISREKWTPEEDEKLLEAQRQLGNKWSKIGALLPGRTENAIKTRAKSLARAKLKAWTPEEDQIIIDAKTSAGTSNTRASAWSKIAERLNNRSKNAVKKRWKELKGNNAVDSTANSLKRMKVEETQSGETKSSANKSSKRSKQGPTVPLGSPAFSIPKSELPNVKQTQNSSPIRPMQSYNGNGNSAVNHPEMNQFQQQQMHNPQHGLGLVQKQQPASAMSNTMVQSGTTPPLIPSVSGLSSGMSSASQFMVPPSLASKFSSMGVSPGFILPSSSGSAGGPMSSPIATAAGNFGSNANTISTTPSNFYGTTPPATMPNSFNGS
mmetsp:Transcript_8910/g.11594  ORF Transcript_8910/g.11594 Transcript_8910/m.11594 type:complete len:623 (-) Transcript_8910:2189-4057(-)